MLSGGSSNPNSIKNFATEEELQGAARFKSDENLQRVSYDRDFNESNEFRLTTEILEIIELYSHTLEICS
jgi:hypothetical protein